MPQDAFGGGQAPSGRAVRVRRPPPVPNAILAVMMAVGMEIMFFTGLISAFTIVKAGIKPGLWPPPWQPRLPIEATAVNSAVLIASGVLLLVAGLRFKRGKAAPMVMLSLLLGAIFVLVQGYEWVRLLGEGLTLSTSTHSAFFYLIVGAHALHVVGGLCALTWALLALRAGRLRRDQLTAVQIFWSFVVGLWPVLYVLVYL